MWIVGERFKRLADFKFKELKKQKAPEILGQMQGVRGSKSSTVESNKKLEEDLILAFTESNPTKSKGTVNQGWAKFDFEANFPKKTNSDMEDMMENTKEDMIEMSSSVKREEKKKSGIVKKLKKPEGILQKEKKKKEEDPELRMTNEEKVNPQIDEEDNILMWMTNSGLSVPISS